MEISHLRSFGIFPPPSPALWELQELRWPFLAQQGLGVLAGRDVGGADPGTRHGGSGPWGTALRGSHPTPSVGPKGRDTGPRWEMGPGTGRCPHRELGCCGAGTTLAVQKPIYTGSARTVGSRWEHPDTKCPRGCGRDQLLLGTGTRHPATPPLVLMAAALVFQSRCPSRGRQPQCLLGQQEEKEERGCASSALYFGLTLVLL